jgi:hypothetical protein
MVPVYISYLEHTLTTTRTQNTHITSTVFIAHI